MALTQDDLNHIELIIKEHNEVLVDTFESWAGKILVTKLEYEKDRANLDRKILIISLLLVIVVFATIPKLVSLISPI